MLLLGSTGVFPIDMNKLFESFRKKREAEPISNSIMVDEKRLFKVY